MALALLKAETTVEDVNSLVERLIVDSASRVSALRYLAQAISEANLLNPNNWVLTSESRPEQENHISLMAGLATVLSIKRDAIVLPVLPSALPTAQREDILQKYPETSKKWDFIKSFPEWAPLRIPIEEVESLGPMIQEAHFAAIRLSSVKTQTAAQRKFHVSAVIDYLNAFPELHVQLPQPLYKTEEPFPPMPRPPIVKPGLKTSLAMIFQKAGLTYTPWQQAVFFTALQTKGFVILSGISGTGKTKIAQAFAAAMPQPADGTRNVEFLTVRPDWRDSKSLIGYHNPLTDRYEWTPFLRFLLRAYESWRERDGLAWFVILDEMNLAHVEHYFAEMLSIIESGRDDDGWSREAIAIPSNGGEGSPPSRIKLPPNLHIIGTVNLDVTTHAFSPKVLDRAFALEFSDVSFADYLVPSATPEPEFDPLDASELLNALSSDGSFPRVDKTALSAFLVADDRPRIWLESLNRRLRPHHLHFGFRVFDEVVAFVSFGKSNGLFIGMPPNGDEVTAAFDAAAMMKILPKFHGSRSRLDMPLKIVLAWCLNPEIPDLTTISACIASANSPHEMEQALLGLTFHFPKTAGRTIRLLWTAHVEGFAAFG